MKKPIQVFCCCHRKDEQLLLMLVEHLTPIQREGLITVQTDINVSPGDDREQKISQYLDTASIILLLISAAFMASNYCYDKEMKRALERREKGEARVIPVILSPVDWQMAPFAKLECLPRHADPVTTWSNYDQAFSNVAQEIRAVCEDLLMPPSSPPSPKIGIDKIQDGQIVRTENIVFPPHIHTRPGDLRPAFENLITERTRDFVGRQFVFNALDTFLVSQESGYFIIEGDPGIGKSALMAQLVKQRGYLHHFNTTLQRITKLEQFLENICV